MRLFHMITLFRTLGCQTSHIASLAHLRLGPRLDEALLSPEPPSIGFFCTLLMMGKGPAWGVYVVMMEKTSNPCRLYMGSGIDLKGGIVHITDHYYLQILEAAKPR